MWSRANWLFALASCRISGPWGDAARPGEDRTCICCVTLAAPPLSLSHVVYLFDPPGSLWEVSRTARPSVFTGKETGARQISVPAQGGHNEEMAVEKVFQALGL